MRFDPNDCVDSTFVSIIQSFNPPILLFLCGSLWISVFSPCNSVLPFSLSVRREICLLGDYSIADGVSLSHYLYHNRPRLCGLIFCVKMDLRGSR